MTHWPSASPLHLAQDYYHPKSGIFTDAAGDRIAFSGSVNESQTAWQHNYENFSVYFSWNETGPYLAQLAINFERLWAGQEADWIAVEIPAAVRERPVRVQAGGSTETRSARARATACGQVPISQYFAGSAQAERLLFQFVRDAPYLPNATELGAGDQCAYPLAASACRGTQSCVTFRNGPCCATRSGWARPSRPASSSGN